MGFDQELKKSHSTISKLTSLLKKYHSFDFEPNINAANISFECKTNDTFISTLPLNNLFIINFKDICLKIEREWRIGTKQISDFHAKQAANNTESEYYHSDSDASYRYKRKRIKQQHNTRSTSSSPMHSFSNPNSLISSLNIGVSQSQQLQKRKNKTTHSDAAYHAKIGSTFVPYDEQEKLNQDIRNINDDLQYLLDINQSVNDLMIEQQTEVNEIERNVKSAKDNVEDGMNTLTSIRKSPMTYAIMGGLSMAALGSPVIAIGAGIKAAFGGAVGLGTIGAFTGSIYATKINQKMDNENKKDKEERLLMQDNDEQDVKKEIVGIANEKKKKKSYFGFNTSDNDDEEEEIDDWDARN